MNFNLHLSRKGALWRYHVEQLELVDSWVLTVCNFLSLKRIIDFKLSELSWRGSFQDSVRNSLFVHLNLNFNIIINLNTSINSIIILIENFIWNIFRYLLPHHSDSSLFLFFVYSWTHDPSFFWFYPEIKFFDRFCLF